MAVGVDVEVGAKLVHEGGKVLELTVEAAAAGGGFCAVGEPLDHIDMFVDKLCVESYALIRIDAGFANLFDLVFGQRLALLLLRRQKRGKQQADQD